MKYKSYDRFSRNNRVTPSNGFLWPVLLCPLLRLVLIERTQKDKARKGERMKRLTNPRDMAKEI